MAAKYHLLPSQILEQATTFDLYVLDVSTRWANHQYNVANSKNPVAKARPNLSEEEMLELVSKAKQRKQSKI